MNLATFNPEHTSLAELESAQRTLTAAGYYLGALDGVFGPRSKEALARFRAQKATLIETIGGVPIYRTVPAGNRGCVRFLAGMSIDCDGHPRCYSPDDKGLDALANARDSHGRYVGLVTGSGNVPILQGSSDPAPGFCISTTSLQDPGFSERNPLRYVDSGVIPYVALPGGHYPHWGAHLGDLARVSRPRLGLSAWAVFGDVGNSFEAGEGSLALALLMGLDPSPRHGGTTQREILYEVFPGSRAGWPLSPAQLAGAGEAFAQLC